MPGIIWVESMQLADLSQVSESHLTWTKAYADGCRRTWLCRLLAPFWTAERTFVTPCSLLLPSFLEHEKKASFEGKVAHFLVFSLSALSIILSINQERHVVVAGGASPTDWTGLFAKLCLDVQYCIKQRSSLDLCLKTGDKTHWNSWPFFLSFSRFV